nr:protein MAIN-LIKE 2-like [Arachis hypogaea]
MIVCYTWFHERFWVLPADATDETMRIYARAYIMMLLSSQLFADKNANRVHLRWLPYLASLDDLGRYSWGSAALAWWATFMSRNDPGDQRLVSAHLSLDRLRVHDFVWEPYSFAEVGAVIHLEILADEHRRLWTAVTSLIYFAAIEWHQDGRGGDRWFPTYYREWHQHWENRLHSVIWVDRVIDPGPSSDYLEWWCRVAHRFLSPDVAFQDPRPIVLTEEARHRGSSQAPPRVHVYDRPDNRRADRRRRIGTQEDIPRADHGDAADFCVPRRRGRQQAGRDGRGGARGRVPSVDDQGTQHGVGEDVVGSASAMDQPTYNVGSSSQLFGNVAPDAFAGYTTAVVGMDIDDPVTESEFYRDIADMLMDDDGTHHRPQMPDDQPQFADPQPQTYDVLSQLAVDLNEPAASPTNPWIPLGGTPASAFSGVPAQPSEPAAEQRPRRVRRPPLCGTGGHLIGQFDDDDIDTIEDSD